MTQRPRITLRIGSLRITGVNRAEAAAIASALSESLAVGIAANPGALSRHGGTEYLRLTLPASATPGPAALGQATGRRIAGALASAKGAK